MQPLSGLDGAFLHLETPATPMRVGSLRLFDLPPGDCGGFFIRMKRQLARRQRAVPICQRKLALVPLQLVNPVWVHDDAVDFNRHVQRVTLPPQHAGAAGRRRCPPEFRPAGPPPSVVAPVRHRRPTQRPVGLLHTGAPRCAGRTGRCVAGAGAVRRDPEASGNAAPRPRAMAPPGPGRGWRQPRSNTTLRSTSSCCAICPMW